MFERFTEGARAVVVEAQGLALELGSPAITPAHLLYGCAEGREESAGRPLRDAGVTGTSVRRLLSRTSGAPGAPLDHDALRAVGVDADAVQAAVEETFGPGALGSAPDRRTAGRRRLPPFSPDAKQSLEQALRVAKELHDRRLLAGHVLLGLLRMDDPVVSAAVTGAGATVAALSAGVLTGVAAA